MLPHKGSLTRDQRQGQRTEAPSWAPVGWFSLVVIATALTWALCLPVITVEPAVTPRPGQVFGLEWFLLATAIAYLIWRTARSSWIVGGLSVVLASLQMLGIADDGAHRLQQVGLVSAETDMLYLVAVLQVVLYVVAGVSGMRHNLVNRRWARLNRRLAALDNPRNAQRRHGG
jgi:hypothetical protein